MIPVVAPPPTKAAAPTSVEVSNKSVAELAKELAPQALATLHQIANDPEAKDAARVAAASAIIDRAEGKVGIQQETTVNYNVVINQINRALGKAIDVTPESN